MQRALLLQIFRTLAKETPIYIGIWICGPLSWTIFFQLGFMPSKVGGGHTQPVFDQQDASLHNNYRYIQIVRQKYVYFAENRKKHISQTGFHIILDSNMFLIKVFEYLLGIVAVLSRFLTCTFVWFLIHMFALTSLEFFSSRCSSRSTSSIMSRTFD